MRVIAGTARSMPLKTLDGLQTRPTTDRIKETLFNILQADIPGCRFLDLFAGSGSIGIEALSRGAKEAVFVEQDKKAAQCIKDNLQFTRLRERARVMEMDAVSAVSRLDGDGVFDLVHMDAPYGMDLEESVLAALQKSDIIDSYTVIIIEEKLDVSLDYAENMGYEIFRIKKYKTNQHYFLRRK